MPEFYGEPLIGVRFHDQRRTGVGGSDAGAILGVSPFTSRLGVWEDKRGLRAPTEASERMVWGTRLQDAILRGYAEDTGTEVRKGTFRRHPVHPFVIGNPDAEGVRDGRPRLVEVKTTSHLDERWGEDGSEQVPVHYYAQVQHYLLLRSLEVADLTALVGGRELRTYVIPANPAFQAAMLEDERAFWRLVVEGTPPEPDGSDDAGRALRVLYPSAVPEEVVANEVVTGYALSYTLAKRALAEAEREADRWAQAMQSFMGYRERLVGPGFRATWANRAGSVSWKSVAADSLTALQLLASAPEETDAALLRQAARETVEGWSALQAKHRGEPTRVFKLTRTTAEGEPTDA
jgi:putative phage-type endonuclease